MQISQLISLVLTGALVYGLCRLLRLKPVYPVIARPKRSALCSLASVSASMLIILLVLMLISQKPGPTQGVGHEHHRNLVDQLFILFVYFLPMALMLRLNGEKLQSVGLTRVNLWKATVVGLFLATATILLTDGGPGAVFKFTEGHNMNSFIHFSFVGFGEEILLRGFLQSRLVAWLGQYKGLIFASVITALMHLPQRLLIQDMGFPDAIASSLGLIPISLFQGFVMLRTGNAIAPSVYHTFANWVWIR